MIDRDIAHSKLSELIERGREHAKAGIEALQDEYIKRKDFMVKADKMTVEVGDNGEVRPVINDSAYETTGFARKQLFDRAKMPTTYADDLNRYGLGTLLKANLEMMFPRVSKEGILVRTVENRAKGILSSSYKRIDSTPIFESYIEESMKNQFVPHSGIITDTRAFLSFLLPEVIDIGGDFVVLGTQIRSSDYGRGKLQIDLMIERLICGNGMMGMDVFSKVHLGRRFDSDEYGENDAIELSNRTARLDIATVRSAIKDIVAGLTRRQFPAIRNLLTEAAKGQDKFNVGSALALMTKRGVKKAVVETVKEYYEGNVLPVESIPQEPGAWRFANIVSLISKSQKGDDSMDTKDLAFEILTRKAA